LYERRGELAANREAVTLYAEEIKQTPEAFDPYWKAARAAWWAGTQTPQTDKAGKIKLFTQGMEWGRIAVEKKPGSAEAQFWYGSNCASYGHTKGALTSLFLIKKIRRSMEAMNKIDETYMGAGAHRVLGILDYMIPGMVGGNRQKALAHLTRALEIAPQHPVTHFYLADYYAEGNEVDKARAKLDELNRLPILPEYGPEWQVIQPEREALQKRLAKKS